MIECPRCQSHMERSSKMVSRCHGCNFTDWGPKDGYTISYGDIEINVYLRDGETVICFANDTETRLDYILPANITDDELEKVILLI